jgi:fatty acid-binding protein DegV
MVKITTDTTSMYTVSEGKAMGIDLVPMTLIAGDKSYREIEEINVDELKTDPQLMGALGAAEYARQKGLAKVN